MSTYYEFYVAARRDDKIEAVGPYVRKEDGSFRLTPLLTRSRSFIQWNEFGAWELQVEKMTEDQLEHFTDTGWFDERRRSIAYFIPYREICAMADDGLVQDYVTLDELDRVARNDYDPECFWDLDVRSPQAAAEMDPETRKGYGHIAYVDRNSTGYICSQLLNTAEPIDYGLKEEEMCFIVRVC